MLKIGLKTPFDDGCSVPAGCFDNQLLLSNIRDIGRENAFHRPILSFLWQQVQVCLKYIKKRGFGLELAQLYKSLFMRIK